MNGDELVQTTRDENDVETEVPPKTAQAILARQRERKAKSILLLAIPEEYQLRFHIIKDAKSLWVAIKSRFGGNVESKKMQKTAIALLDNPLHHHILMENALIVQDGLGYDWSYIAQEEPIEFSLMAYTLGSDIEKNKVIYEEKITVLEFKVKDKGYGDQLSKSDSEVLPSVFDSRSSDGDDNLTNDRPTTNKASANISKGEPSVIKTSNISVAMPKVDLVRTSGEVIED
nr:xylulose kinase-1 [Tanacetum cinerariifolium]